MFFLQDVLKKSLRGNGLYEAKLKDTGSTLDIIIFSLASLLLASAFRSLRSFLSSHFPLYSPQIAIQTLKIAIKQGHVGKMIIHLFI